MMYNKGMAMALMAMSMMGPPRTSSDKAKFHDDGNPPKKVIPKGMKEFVIDGKVYYAINYKNALRKSKQLK